MEDAIATIDQIIEEHRVILEKAQELEQVANDAEAMLALYKAGEVFMPGTLDQSEGLRKLRGLHVTVEEGLVGHFNREETRLLAAFQRHGDKRLVSALETLLLDHKGVRDRLDEEKRRLAEITEGQLSRHLWEAKAHDLRVHLNHTRKLLETHAQKEQELLHKLRKELSEAP